MNIIKLSILFLVSTSWAFGQTEEITGKDAMFLRYLTTHSKTIAESILKDNDGVYSLYCKAVMAEDGNEQIDFYTQFIKKNPKYGMANGYRGRGLAYTMLGKNDSAIVDLSKSIELDNKEAYTYYFRGATYAAMEKYDKAIVDYSQAISIAPNFSMAYYMRGISYTDLNNNTSAINDFDKTIEFNREFVDNAYLMKGITYYHMGEYENAITQCTNAKKKNDKLAKKADEIIEKATKKMQEQEKEKK